MYSYLAAAVTLTWIIATTGLLAQTLASGAFEVQLMSSSVVELDRNESGRPEMRGKSPLPIRTHFRICFSHYQASIPDEPGCTYGQRTTPTVTAATESSAHGQGHLDQQTAAGGRGGSTPLANVTFSFAFTWPGTFSLIVDAVSDYEGEPSGEKVNGSERMGSSSGSSSRRIGRVAVQRSLRPADGWQILILRAAVNGSLRSVFRYRVTCSTDYYGPGCAETCKPRDDKFGHYRCSEDGTKDCLHGWTGQYCDKAVCLPGCNEKSGFCDEPHECRCRLGWHGPACDSCIRYPGCQHGTCNKPWECECQDGWGGLFCNQDLNFCTNHRPCRNGATCINTGQGSYTCVCSTGHTGTNCEMEANDCRPTNRTCINGGVCTAVGESDFECRCPVGLYGRRCELMLASGCEQEPCRNGGTCVAATGDREYRCSCAQGFTGLNCEQQTDECRSQPCANGGSCVDDTNGFRCVCPSGFRGDRCQDDHDDCAVSPCLNGGRCVDRVNAFECLCPAGFVGSLCQDDVDECLNFPCANGAACRDLPRRGFRCTCTAGFTGPFCTVRVDTCAGRPCLHGASCRANVDSYECTCAAGYYGSRCEFVEARDDGGGGGGGGGVIHDDRGVTGREDGESSVTRDFVPEEVQRLMNVDVGASTAGAPQVSLIVGACLSGVLLTLAAGIAFLVVWRRRRRHAMARRQLLSFEGQRQREVSDAAAKRLNNKMISLELDAAAAADGIREDDSGAYLSLIDSKESQRDSSSSSNAVNRQNNLNELHRNCNLKQNNLRNLSTKDVNNDLRV